MSVNDSSSLLPRENLAKSCHATSADIFQLWHSCLALFTKMSKASS